VHKIWQLVLFVKKIFFSLESDIHLIRDHQVNKTANTKLTDCNQEAVRLFFEDYEGFESRVMDSVQQSRARVYETPVDAEDRNAILFGPWNPETHESARRAFLTGRSPDQMDTQSLIHQQQHHNHQETSGMSWVQVTPAAQFRSFS
jgi:hypothetical protein